MSARALRKAADYIQKRVLPIVLLTATIPAFAQEAKAPARDAAKIEEATRLQVFLDRANFGPGKIDGRGGEFTKKALERYRQANGGGEPAKPAATAAPQQPAPEGKKGEEPALDTTGLDLASVDPVFTDYAVVKDDLDHLPELPETPEEQAKLKWLGYTGAAEAIAERFHCDIDFLKELNPEANLEALKEGDRLKVPNVEPFELAKVKDLEPGSEIGKAAALEAEQVSGSGDEVEDVEPAEEKKNTEKQGKKDKDKKDKGKKEDDAETKRAVASLSLFVSTKESIVELRDGDKLRAAFPITSGSEETASPLGEWKVQGVAKLPDFRYDKKMLKEGKRSSDFHVLPPGPNNPVGVVWIALNNKGIGLHGTDSPDTIGRSASHGCIRLANWDVVKLARMVKAGVAVKIE